MKSGQKKEIYIYVFWAAGILGLVFLVHCIWLQVYSPSALEENIPSLISPFAIFVAVAGGAALGATMINYIRVKSSKNEENNDFRKVVKPKELKSMMIGFIVSEVICLILAYFATIAAYFLLGLAGAAFSVCTILYFLIWVGSVKKQEAGSGKPAKG